MTDENKEKALYPYSKREVGSICPIYKDVCPEDPQKCSFWQPIMIADLNTAIQTPTPVMKQHYLCVTDQLIMLIQTVSMAQQGVIQYQQRKI